LTMVERVDAQNLRRIEPVLQRLQSLTHQVSIASRMDAYVVVGCFNPIDLFNPNK
jgi:hypothetical protein